MKTNKEKNVLTAEELALLQGGAKPSDSEAASKKRWYLRSY